MAYDANKSGKKEVKIAVPLKYLSNFCNLVERMCNYYHGKKSNNKYT